MWADREEACDFQEPGISSVGTASSSFVVAHLLARRDEREEREDCLDDESRGSAEWASE